MNRIQEVLCATGDTQKRTTRGVRCAAWLALLMCASHPSLAAPPIPCPGIHVKILGINSNKGTVACALFESPAGFPIEYLGYATNIMVIKVRKAQARCDFLDIPPGTYSLAVIHDENMNGKLDTNWLGVPKEGYGFSNDATSLLGAPSFAAASFRYGGQNLELKIKLHY